MPFPQRSDYDTDAQYYAAYGAYINSLGNYGMGSMDYTQSDTPQGTLQEKLVNQGVDPVQAEQDSSNLSYPSYENTSPGMGNIDYLRSETPTGIYQKELINQGVDPIDAEKMANDINPDIIDDAPITEIKDIADREAKDIKTEKKETDILSFLNNLLTTSDTGSASPNLSQLAVSKSELNPVQMLAMKLQNIDKDLAEWIWNMSELPLEQIAEQVEFRYNLSLANQYERRNYNGMGLQNSQKVYRKKKYPKNYSKQSLQSRYSKRY